MNLKQIAIVIVWVVFLADAFSKGIALGHAHNPPGTVAPFPPIWFWAIALPFFFAFFSVGVFCLRHRQFSGGWLRYLIDWRWGAGTYGDFFRRLRPTALMMLWCLILGVVGLSSTYANEQSSYAYSGGAFFLTCGLGLLLAYVFALRIPPRLY
jgi:hypothetical protein